MRLTEFFNLYKICIFLHRCNLKIFAKNRFALFVKIQQNFCKFSQNLQNLAKFQKFQLDNLVDFEKCCKTHIFLQTSVPIQPKTNDILPKFCKKTGNYPTGHVGPEHPRWGLHRGHPGVLRDQGQEYYHRSQSYVDTTLYKSTQGKKRTVQNKVILKNCIQRYPANFLLDFWKCCAKWCKSTFAERSETKWSNIFFLSR